MTRVPKIHLVLKLLLWILLETLFHFRRVIPLDLDASAPLRLKLLAQNLLGSVVLVVIRILSTLFSRSFCSLVDKKGEM